MTKQLQATLAAILVISAISVPAQTTTATPAHTAAKGKKKPAAVKVPKESATERQIRELREQMQNQQAEIDSLKEQSAAKDAALAAAQQSATSAQTVAAAATSQAQTVNQTVQANADAVASLQGTVTDLKNSNTGLALTISETKKDLTDKIESPTAIHYRGVLIQPSGFMAAESVYRTRAINSDINTPFAATPYMNTAQAYTSEFNATGRQSRLALQVKAPTSWGNMGGYYEMDFLSAGTTSNDNQTNSYSLRQREAWLQANTNKGFSFTGGQMWTLATEVKKGITEIPNNENLPQTVDPQYHVGFTFTRQYALRFAQAIGTKQNVAIALEEAQTVLAGTTNAPTNFFIGGAGNPGGLYNNGGFSGAQNYSSNVAPDIIVKYAADPGFGHFEIGGMARFFRDRYYPQLPFSTTATTTPVGSGTNNTVVGGGFFVNARVPIKKYADVGVHILQGDGTGRYGTSNLGDVTVKPNGTLEPLRNSQGLFSIETHPAKKLDVYGYAGGEYLQRTSYATLTTATATAPATTVYVGYAPIQGEKDAGCFTELPPSNSSGYAPGAGGCPAHTRAVMEGSLGFTYRIYSSPTKGRVQYQMVYSYLTKESWTGLSATGSPLNPKATNNMVFTGFRYYIP